MGIIVLEVTELKSRIRFLKFKFGRSKLEKQSAIVNFGNLISDFSSATSKTFIPKIIT